MKADALATTMAMGFLKPKNLLNNRVSLLFILMETDHLKTVLTKSFKKYLGIVRLAKLFLLVCLSLFSLFFLWPLEFFWKKNQ